MWITGLLKVRFKYGCPATEESDFFAAVRESGCTDEKRMQQIIEEVYLPLRSNCQKEAVRDINGN